MENGARLDAVGVAAGRGLREREGGHVLARRELRQVLGLERRVAEEQDALEADALMRAEVDGHAQVLAAERLGHEAVARV
jgi:hypothetical protein